MKTTGKLAITLIIVGLIMAGAGFLMGGGNAIYLDRGRWGLQVASRENTKLQIDEQLVFDRLQIDTSVADVRVTSGDRFSVIAEYHDTQTPQYTLEGGLLHVFDSGKQRIGMVVGLAGISTPKNYIHVTLPRGAHLAALDITSDVGSLVLESIEAQTLTTRSDLGSLRASDVRCGDWEATSNVGDMRFFNVSASGNVKITTDAGAIEARGLQTTQLNCRTDVGEIDITQLQSDALNAHTDLGSIHLQGAMGGTNELTTNVGEISFESTFPRNTYLVEADSDIGKVSIQPAGMPLDTGSIVHRLTANSDLGSIWLKFSE